MVEDLAAKACDEYGEEYCIVKATEKCKSTSKPIDFIYERKTDSFNLDRYQTNDELIGKVQTGKGDATFIHYGYKNIYIKQVFAGTIPQNVE